MPVSIGIDLVAIADVREAIERQGQRYLAGVYSEAELHECGGRAPCLAARFAAKEAAAKALRADRGLAPRSISVELDERSRPVIVLADGALELARARGVTRCSVDLRVGRSQVLALVLAHVDPGAL
jgi:holo-[acyl-carrier protein] synthase